MNHYYEIQQLMRQQGWDDEDMGYLATIFIVEANLGEEYVNYLRSNSSYDKSLEVECND